MSLVGLPALKSVANDPAVRKSFEEVLGTKTPGFISSILSAASLNKGLLECEPISIMRSAAIAAALDLPINQNFGFAWLVPYKGVCTFQMGWKGYVQLGQRSKQYVRMEANPVFEGQIKSRNRFTGDFEFQEAATSDKKEGYVFYFRLLTGFEKYFYLTAPELDDHAKRFSQSYRKGGGVWAENFDAMALKTVTKLSLSKWGPMSIQMQDAMHFDGAEVLDIVSKQVRYPDNQITAESSAEKLAELQAEKADLIPGLKPEKTAQQFYDEVIAMQGGYELVKSTIKNLEEAGHKRHADQLAALLQASEGK